MPPEKRSRFADTHTLKIPILLQSDSGETEGFIFDYTAQGIAIFCNKTFASGDKIKVTQIKGKPITPFHCSIVSFQASPTKGTVISPNFPVFKGNLTFEPQSDEERKLLAALLKELSL